MHESNHNQTQALDDLVSLAFAAEEFSPMQPEGMGQDGFSIRSGSYRSLRGYDVQAGCGVEVIEFMCLFVDVAGSDWPVRRIGAVWDDGSDCEFDTDADIIVTGNGPDASEAERQAGLLRLRQALEAVLP